MNKTLSFLLISFILSIITLRAEDVQHISIPEFKSDKALAIRSGENFNFNQLDDFLEPISFTVSGLQEFAINALNRKDYINKFLPLNLCHAIDFMQFGSTTKLPRACIAGALDMFAQKLKATNFINFYEVSNFVEKLHTIVQQFVTVELFIREKKSIIKNVVYKNFFNNFEQFKLNPELFVDKLSYEIIDELYFSQEERDASIEKLQQSISEFLEVIINRLAWSPIVEKDIWEYIKLLSCQLQALADNNIISGMDMLDKHYWALIHRFSYFLKLTGSDISINTYDKILNDLETKFIPLLHIDEQEDFLTTKKSYLRSEIFAARTKAMAKFNGIICEDIIVPN